MLWMQQVIFAKNLMLLLQFLFAYDTNVTMGECWRTPQQAHWNYLHHLGIEHSLHCDRLAVDLIFHDNEGKFIQDPKQYSFAGKYWESLHPCNRWGGNFKHGIGCDPTHFEMQHK